MVCWPLWLVVVALTGAGALGFVLCFVWYWWVLSNARAEPKGS